MTTKANNPVIARADCPTSGCGGRLGVMQNKRQYLYSRCSGCGIDQRNGAAHQVWLWQHLEPVDGAVIERPANVPDGAGVMGCALKGEQPAAVEAVPRAGAREAKERESTRAAEQAAADDGPIGGGPVGAGGPIGEKEGKKGGGGLVWLLIGAATMGVAALASAGSN